MGALIFLGLSQSASDLVILATLPVVLLALSTDKAFQWLEHRLIVKVGTRHDTAEQHL
jgi:osmoprotectant transport system permease protein